MLAEGEDFYYNENGLMVLTALYLKKRGYCCKNACKHCPYGFHDAKNEEMPFKSEKQENPKEPDKTM